MNRNKNYLIAYFAAFAFFLLFAVACSDKASENTQLPILGEREVVQREVNGQTVTDTLYPQIPSFAFVNQDSQLVTNHTFEDKIYVADFFFTTCPTICPKMKSQMLRVYEKFMSNPRVMLLSHTIDPTHDSVAVLREYAERLEVNSNKWQFVTGEKDSIYSIAEKYMVTAQEDEQEPGGFVHSGAFVLVDANHHVRGIYDGTDPAQVDKLMKDISILLHERKAARKAQKRAQK